MIFKNPSALTKLEIWAPKYSTQYQAEYGERVALLAQYKVRRATPWILIEFTKAKHLFGQRFCIKRETVERCALASNTKIPCYAVPMSYFEAWDTVEEVKQIANNIFEF